MNTKYLPLTPTGIISRLAEECAEVGAACSKTVRISAENHNHNLAGALRNYNPELPPEERETNRDWILREIRDLKHAIERAERLLK